MKSMQRGFSLIEALAALAIGAMMMIGVASMMDAPLEETQGQQAGLHQLQVTHAAAQYIKENYTELIVLATAAAPAPVPVTVDMLRTAGYLSLNFPATNSYGQTPCVLVLQPATNKLDALIVTEGGSEIPARTLPYVAANAGQGGGYIESSGGNLVARVGSASVASATLTSYLSRNCTGTAATAGRLANSLFYDGPGRLTTDFLYRDAITGREDLNTMTTSIKLMAGAVEDTSDTTCAVGNTKTWNGIVVNANGAILSCQSGVWRRQGSRFWRDPVLNFDNPNGLPTANNEVGDVRMVTSLQRAFTWNVTAGVGSWVALAVDENGVLKTDYVQLNKAVIKGDACSPNGLVARDADGLILSCQSGKWDTQATIELGSNETSCQRIRPSKFAIAADEANCPTIFPQVSISYISAYDTYYATISRPVTLTKNGLISIGAWSLFSRGLVSDPNNATGQSELVISIKDASNNVIASSLAKTPYLTNTATGINVPLSKSAAKGTYTVEITTAYSLFDGGAKTFNESNFTLFDGSTLQETPLMTGWNIDVFY